MFFKYIKYTREQLEFTTLEFRGGSDDFVIVNNFSTKDVVSIKSADALKIDALIAEQLCPCVEITLSDFKNIIQDTKQYERAVITRDSEIYEGFLADIYGKDINAAIQNLLDAKAQELRYDNIMSVRSYAGFVSPFQTEAQTIAVWAADCWVKAGEIEAAVLAGTRPMPTVAEVLAEMPVL